MISCHCVRASLRRIEATDASRLHPRRFSLGSENLAETGSCASRRCQSDKPLATLITLMVLAAPVFCGSSVGAQMTVAMPSDASTAPSKFFSEEDGWVDASGFLDEAYGFLPVAIPITEPAVGYGAAGGLTFISKPLSDAQAGFSRPNITIVGGLGTENGTWGAMAGDVRTGSTTAWKRRQASSMPR